MAEQVYYHFAGGPSAGNHFTSTDIHPWPLADRVIPAGQDGAGCYVKVSESQLPPQDPDSAVIRGAAYEWQEAT